METVNTSLWHCPIHELNRQLFVCEDCVFMCLTDSFVFSTVLIGAVDSVDTTSPSPAPSLGKWSLTIKLIHINLTTPIKLYTCE